MQTEIEYGIKGFTLEEFEREYERINNDSRFTIYPNNIPILFTKEAASLSVIEQNNKVESRYEMLSEYEAEEWYSYGAKPGELPHVRQYQDPPEGMSWREFDNEIRKINTQTSRTLTHMIYDSLVSNMDDRLTDSENNADLHDKSPLSTLKVQKVGHIND